MHLSQNTINVSIGKFNFCGLVLNKLFPGGYIFLSFSVKVVGIFDGIF